METIRVEFQRSTLNCSLDMPFRLDESVTRLTTGVRRKFIYFWKLPFLHAKYQLILINLNFDDFED